MRTPPDIANYERVSIFMKEKDTEVDFEAAYDAFIVDVKQNGQVWGLNSEDGWATCPSAFFEETDVIPFWSTEAAARGHCSEEWSGYQPEAISLEEFVTDWLPGMHEDDLLIGPNWDEELEGLEIEPQDLAAELGQGLEDQQE
ncbi:DUF2750 domain-containing protein [Thiofilum flexile]|uniref:DUF2750 domain-containing protein n=1 Tax=Thiofilum flexile TaxID=125627 RepID=UPI00036F6A4F|nr:DUF2750 domain-containing protein [Thiofilum flexile]